ncbi:MAG: RES family NAD+ phosphorylase [Candidatus Cyclobacteriaceae bacterium M2_1C_046]
MQLYRIERKVYVSDLPTGEGCDTTRGRWNYAGTRVIYLSGSPALAILEKRVNNGTFPNDPLQMLEYEIKNNFDILTIRAEDLRTEWSTSPPPDFLKKIAQAWIDEGKYWIMKVPSAIYPRSHNYLLNPNHKDHLKKNLKLISSEDFSFDRRLYKS